MNNENYKSNESQCDSDCNEDFIYCVEHGNFSCMNRFEDCDSTCSTD